jgi:predicted NAD/FAD-binding protein
MDRVCIVGGGATAGALLWCLAQSESARAEISSVTIIHDGQALGGHSFTVDVTRTYDGKAVTLPVDLGVQLVSPMLYANLHLMLETVPEIASAAPVTEFDSLRLACGFPDRDGKAMNWANFDAYQNPATFSMYTEAMRRNATTFQDFTEVALLTSAKESLSDYFANQGLQYGSEQDCQDFLNYFMYPYLSIINGYGASLMDEMLFADIAPLFMKVPLNTGPLASFTSEGKGWQRFTNGAGSWVQAMADVGAKSIPTSITRTSTVTSVQTDESTGKVTVSWSPAPGATTPGGQDVFDKVFLTVDINVCADLLADNVYWNDHLKQYLDKPLWELQPGYCVIHEDPTVLSPHLRNTDGQTGFEQETLQFTAYFAPQADYPYYDLFGTYTTYIQENLLQNPAAKGLYNTMYGYIPTWVGDPKAAYAAQQTNPQYGPETPPVPNPDTWHHAQAWTHGHFAPSVVSPARKALYNAQAPGKSRSYPTQKPTGVYIAGNNTTYDSEDGALEAAMIIAGWAYDVPYPLLRAGLHTHLWPAQLIGHWIYSTYFDLMFPGHAPSDPSHRLWGLLAGMRHVQDAS